MCHTLFPTAVCMLNKRKREGHFEHYLDSTTTIAYKSIAQSATLSSTNCSSVKKIIIKNRVHCKEIKSIRKGSLEDLKTNGKIHADCAS